MKKIITCSVIFISRKSPKGVQAESNENIKIPHIFMNILLPLIVPTPGTAHIYAFNLCMHCATWMSSTIYASDEELEDDETVIYIQITSD